jgi:acyl-CoA reductase-like NAD-dependent aldehyde dehydrogenase
VDAESEARFTCYSPLDNSIVRDDIHTATEKDVDKAVSAAKQEFAVWSKTAPDVRGRVLTKFAELLEAHAAPLAKIEALCGGKPVKRLCVSDIAMAANTWRCKRGALDSVRLDR